MESAMAPTATDFVSGAICVQEIPGLGRTLVATCPIAAGTLLLSEAPLLTSIRTLPTSLQAAIDCDSTAPRPDTVKNAHAFACTSEAVQDVFLRGCCGDDLADVGTHRR